MGTSLSAQIESGNLVAFCESSPRAAAKHVAACESSGKAYLRSIYGRQPRNGPECGRVLSASVNGSIVTIEIRLIVGKKTHTSMFQVPLHVFKKDGASIASCAALEDFIGRFVIVVVIDRYKFNGILLSNVGEIILPRTVGYDEPNALSLARC